jgi:hypothetical protein
MSKPSRADLLKQGGIYPVVIPLGWKLVGPAGEDIDIPAVPGQPFHRVLAQGAIMAVEPELTGQPEAMTVRRFSLPGSISPEILDRYASDVLQELAKKGLTPTVAEKRVGICALSDEPCGRLVIDRGPADGRTEIHFVVRDQRSDSWELTYLVRQANLDRWRSLLADIEGRRATDRRSVHARAPDVPASAIPLDVQSRTVTAAPAFPARNKAHPIRLSCSFHSLLRNRNSSASPAVPTWRQTPPS